MPELAEDSKACSNKKAACVSKDNAEHFPLCCSNDTECRFVTQGLERLEALYVISIKNYQSGDF